MNRSILQTVFVAMIMAFLAISGCAGVGMRLDPPRVSLANIQIKEVTGLETAFEIKMRVLNANDVDLQVRGIKAELDINGQPFATGVSNTPVEIPSYGSELVTVTVYSSVIKMFKSVYGLTESQALSYQLKGNIRVSAGSSMLPTTLPYRSQGRVTLKPPDRLSE